MSFDEIINKINLSSTEVFLHFAFWKGKDGDENLSSCTPTIMGNIPLKVKEIVTNSLKNNSSCEIDPYNVVGVLDGHIEQTQTAEFKNKINKVLTSLANPIVIDDKNINSDNFHFIIYEFKISGSDNSIFAFRKLRSLKFLKKGFIGQFIDGTFTGIDSKDLLGIDDCVDFIIYEEQVFIFQHTSFERILKLKNEFIEIAEEVLSNEVFRERIDRFDELKDSILSNSNSVKRISKLKGNKKTTLFLNDLNKTKEISDKFDLGIEVDLVNQVIKYEDVSQTANFINFMQDAYYQTLLAGENGVDPRR